ncbi:MAG: sugar phosphate isomerase/epimerase family protein [Armatimonadota bacterium]
MTISVQMGLLPGTGPAEQARWGADHGAEGIELSAWGGIDQLRRSADAIRGILPITSVCGNCDADGNGSFDFLDPDPAKRRRSLDGSRAILAFCGEVGAAGQIVPPIFGPPRVPDLSPLMSPLAIEEGLMLATLRELGPVAHAHGTLFLVEPLNRYEQHYLRRLGDAARVIDASEAPGLGILADLFHMHIEETDSPAALRSAGSRVRHVHLADNTRMEPGSGDIDLGACFDALAEIGFTGTMAYECGVRGEDAGERATALARSLAHVRALRDRARLTS